MKNFTKTLMCVLCLLVSSVVYSQSRTLTGTVISGSTKQPIIGATVMVQGSNNGAYSMDGGVFSIPNVTGAVNLDVTFIGYQDQTLAVSASETNITIKLVESAAVMDEVVVVAFGQSDKKSLTGSVAVVSSKKIENRPITNVVSAMHGSAPGIQVASAGGAPGSSPTVRIRGTGSINASSDPLYVVDGIPFTGRINSIATEDIESMSILKDASSAALYGSRAANGVIMITTKKGRKDKITFNVKINEGVSFIARPDYEVLNSEQFYETSWERYRNNQIFRSKKSPEEAAKLANEKFLTSELKYNVMRDKNTHVQIPSNQVVSGVRYNNQNGENGWAYPQINQNAEVMPGYTTDDSWLDEATGVGLRQSYSINASGGSEKATYFGSMNYINEDGYLDNTSFENLTARMKGDYKPTKWLELGINLNVSHSVSKNPYTSGSLLWQNPWFFARFMAPIYPVFMHDQYSGEYILDSNGEKIYDLGNGYDDGVHSTQKRPTVPGWNVLYQGNENLNVSKRMAVFGQTYAKIKFLRDFSFTVDYTATNYTNRYRTANNPVAGDGAPSGTAYASTANNFEWNFKQMLRWNRDFGQHSIDILAGHDAYNNTYEFISLNKKVQLVDGITQLANYSEITSGTGYETQYSTEGYLASANYNYADRYFVSGTFRRDGNSKFHPSRQWGNFWSVGGSWIASDEAFMSDVMWLDFLKLRVSYGALGNDGGIGLYDSQGLYSLSNLDGNPVTYWSSDGSPDVGWETVKTFDIGVDFRLWNRVNGTLEFFNKTSDELIFSVPQAISTGQTSVDQNIGAMYNRGMEFAVDVDIIRTKDWYWNVGINGTWVTNKITRLADEHTENGIIDGSKKYMVGHGIYDYWLAQTGGIDPEDGSILYVLDTEKKAYNPDNKDHLEKNGVQYSKSYTDALFDWEDSALPDLYGGISSELTWKNISLNVLFSYKIGGSGLDYTYNRLLGGNTFSENKHVDILTESWRQPGDVSRLPRMQNGDSDFHKDLQDRNLISGSYFALQNVTLTYSFPKKIANKLTLSGLSIYASGENLFQLSALKGYDAASSFSGNSSNGRFAGVATVSIGVNVSF